MAQHLDELILTEVDLAIRGTVDVVATLVARVENLLLQIGH